MFITGLGIGPTLSVFTIVVQNAVPFRKLGVATEQPDVLPPDRRLDRPGACLGTVFGNRLTEELGPQMLNAGVPQQLVTQFSNGATAAGGSASGLIEVGKDQTTSLLANVPTQFRPLVEPYVAQILMGLHEAMSIAIASIFQIGVVTTVAALAVAFAMREIPLRTTHGPEPKPVAEKADDTRREPSGRPVVPAAD